MIKKEIYEKTLKNFFNDNIEYTVDKLGDELKYFYPMINTLKVKIEDDMKNPMSKTITYIDEEFITIVENSKTKQIRKLEKPIDMSTTIMIVSVDCNGKILTIENDTNGFFTIANKEFILFIASLIGKKIKI